MLLLSFLEIAGASVGDNSSEGVSEGLLDVFVKGVFESGPGASLVCLVTGLVVDEGSVVMGPSSEEMGSSVVGAVLLACVVEADSFVVKDAMPAVVLSTPSPAAEPDCPTYHHRIFKIALENPMQIVHAQKISVSLDSP